MEIWRGEKGGGGRKESEETCQELNNATARLDGGEMCGTYAILSSDLFTRVYSSLAEEGGDVNLFKRREAWHERAGWSRAGFRSIFKILYDSFLPRQVACEGSRDK